MSIPSPCVTVGQLVEQLQKLPADTRVALVQVEQQFDLQSPVVVTELTLRCWGEISFADDKIGRAINLLPKEQKRLLGKQRRLA